MAKIIAFVPVRSGSKSIPLKNIKLLCGKPLVYWNLMALQQVEQVDQIIVATDSDLIEKVVNKFHFSKVSIYHRSAENSSDMASTESVMLEYINNEGLNENDVFMLVQATSPLTEAGHFKGALKLFNQNKYDSILTCVRNFRFFWNSNGTSKNYDYMNRPRRQDFEGELMENGAFYINIVRNILDSKNRLSGKIGIYEMPEYTSVEIDEPDDWQIMEGLMQKHLLSKQPKKNIKLFLTDVDGVLTDAGMYYSENGDELKKFNTHDGMAFKLLREVGIKTGIITSENTKIVENRARKLQLNYLYQGKRDGGKLDAAKEICDKEGISLKEIAYIGDDINCLELLTQVGIAACPSNAQHIIKQISGIHVLQLNGGEGVVREFAELVLKKTTII